MKSIGTMIIHLSGLVGTNDLTTWENEFISNITEKTHDGKITTQLTERQIETIERIFNKHFC